MKPLGQATCGWTHLSAGGPSQRPTPSTDHEQQPDEQRADGQAAAGRLARRRDVAQDDGEERPVDEIVDDRRAHDERADRPIEQAQLHEDAGDDRVGGVRQVHADEQRERQEVLLHRRAPERARHGVDQRHAGGDRQQRADDADEHGPPAERLQVGQIDFETGVEQEEEHPELGRGLAHHGDVRRREKQPLVQRWREPAEERRTEDDPADHFPDDRRLPEAAHDLAEEHREPEHGRQLQRQLDEVLSVHRCRGAGRYSGIDHRLPARVARAIAAAECRRKRAWSTRTIGSPRRASVACGHDTARIR